MIDGKSKLGLLLLPQLALLLAVLALGGCLPLPFLGGGGGKPKGPIETQERQFARNNVFVGVDGKGRPIIELRLVSQTLSASGLLINTRLFPTENFEVRNIFRGLRSINYYPIERRFHRLELEYGRRDLKIKVKENLQVKDDGKPVDAAFEHTGFFSLLPDTVDQVKLKFQDVERWVRMPEDTLEIWYGQKEQLLQELDRRQRRSDLVDSYRRLGGATAKKTIAQYDTLFITGNSTYVYLEKRVDSEILLTVNAGDKLDFGVSDGMWVEIPLPDSLRHELDDLLETRHQRSVEQFERQRQLARTRRGPATTPEVVIDTTRRFTGYVLDAMVQQDYGRSVRWELDQLVGPVDVPLFAKALADRQTQRQARIDSLERAHADSLARADSLSRAPRGPAADSGAVDSAAATAAATAAAIPDTSLAARLAVAKAQADSVRNAALQAAGAPAPGTAAGDSLRAARLAAAKAQADSVRQAALEEAARQAPSPAEGTPDTGGTETAAPPDSGGEP